MPTTGYRSAIRNRYKAQGVRLARANRDTRTSVRLVVSQAIFRVGLELLIDAERDLRILSSRSRVDADITLVDLADIDALDTIRTARRQSRFIALSEQAEPDELDAVLKAGVRGVVIKTAHPASLLQAIRSVSQGRKWLDPELQEMLMSIETLLPSQHHRWKTLTKREREVATLVLRGLRYKDVGAALSISQHTVRNHLRSIFTKLQITSRVELAPYAGQLPLQSA